MAFFLSVDIHRLYFLFLRRKMQSLSKRRQLLRVTFMCTIDLLITEKSNLLFFLTHNPHYPYLRAWRQSFAETVNSYMCR